MGFARPTGDLLNIIIPGELLALMGISVGSGLAAGGIKNDKDARNVTVLTVAKPQIRQFITAEEGSDPSQVAIRRRENAPVVPADSLPLGSYLGSQRIDLRGDVSVSLSFLGDQFAIDVLDGERLKWTVDAATYATWLAMQHEWGHILCPERTQ